MNRLWIVSYDIADNRRRRQLDKLLLGLGDRHLESLFECWLRADQVPGVERRIRALLDPAADRLAMVPVCRDCQRRTRSHGLGRSMATQRYHFFVV